MAIVEFSRKDFESLIGRKLSDSEITEKITMMGFPLEKIEGEKIFYEVFPNRPDMLSVEGFARSVRYFLGIDKKVRKYQLKPSRVRMTVEKSVKPVRPFAVAAVVENLKFTDDFIASVMQIQEKLHETLGRKRKKVAIGIHDMEKVKPPFVYKAVSPEEISFVPLDMEKKMNLREILEQHEKGKKYAHILEKAKQYPVILDRNDEVLSFPPIINGDLTRVTENTKKIFIDITGTSMQAVIHALNIISTSFIERGCTVKTVEIADVKKIVTPNLNPSNIKTDIGYIKKLTGTEISEKEFKALLLRMGMDFRKEVLVPAYRTDIMHPIDIAEEIAIAYGYQNFTPEIPKISTIAKSLESSDFSNALRDIMTGMGCQEVICMILTNETDEFSKMNAEISERCETSNPTTVECTMTRKLLLPSLLRTLSMNKNKEYPQRIFEIGNVVIPDINSETGASSRHGLALAISDVEASYEDVSSALDALMKNLGIDYELRKADNKSFSHGRHSEIFSRGNRIGIMGEVHPLVLENWRIEKPVAAFEIFLEALKK